MLRSITPISSITSAYQPDLRTKLVISPAVRLKRTVVIGDAELTQAKDCSFAVLILTSAPNKKVSSK